MLTVPRNNFQYIQLKEWILCELCKIFIKDTFYSHTARPAWSNTEANPMVAKSSTNRLSIRSLVQCPNGNGINCISKQSQHFLCFAPSYFIRWQGWCESQPVPVRPPTSSTRVVTLAGAVTALLPRSVTVVGRDHENEIEKFRKPQWIYEYPTLRDAKSQPIGAQKTSLARSVVPVASVGIYETMVVRCRRRCQFAKWGEADEAWWMRTAFASMQWTINCKRLFTLGSVNDARGNIKK